MGRKPLVRPGHRLPDQEVGCELAVFAVPRSSRTEVAGMHGDALRIRVAAPPVEGVANEAIRRFVADSLGISISDVSVVSGATGRRKRLSVSGVDRMSAMSRLLPDPDLIVTRTS